MSSMRKVIAKARELIDATPQGKRFSELQRELSAAFPDIRPKNIGAAISAFRVKLPKGYYMPARGLYRNVKFKAPDEVLLADRGRTRKPSRESVIEKAKELIDATPQGKRFSELQRELSAAFPDIRPKTIEGAISEFRAELPETYYMPIRGLYRNVKFNPAIEELPPGGGEPLKDAKTKIREAAFYESFSDWLVNGLEEATKAIPLGGKLFKDKWGTPDVIGVRDAKRSEIIKFPTEIICAEIKLDVAELITAFGQCCSFKLFSHKSYLVVPSCASEEDIDRLESLAQIFGIGLVTFNRDDPKNPQFRTLARASRQEPDMFYANKYIRLVEEKLF
jgi:hypothetical protein